MSDGNILFAGNQEELRTMLQGMGLDICTAAEREVLEAVNEVCGFDYEPIYVKADGLHAFVSQRCEAIVAEAIAEFIDRRAAVAPTEPSATPPAPASGSKPAGA